ncbi:MAG: nucleoside-diphosphate-sugar pyrophosphorylase [Betaproteobacteria bacterium]|nr:nucleoside-diphosphate-sugar pyrophosphorylase [Betaproteobacteria bacterium]
MSKRAVILAGGKGTRLRPYTIALPKPLVPVGDTPILELIIKQLAHSGFTHITMAVNHQAEIIKAFFQDGAKWGLRIDYSLEDKPLSTMAPLRLVKDLPAHFLVMNGDILTDLNFADFHDAHVARDGIFTISSYMREEMIDYGVLDTDAQAKLTGFREKPRHTYEVSMGIYMVSRRALDWIPADTAFGFDHLMHALIGANVLADVRRYSGYWLDIGRPDDYARAIEEFEKDPARFTSGPM